jgi:hypothetical protein
MHDILVWKYIEKEKKERKIENGRDYDEFH